MDGHVRRSYGHGKPLERWDVLLKDHHEGYTGWAEYERNQATLAVNTYGKSGGVKSGRGGRALLAGFINRGRGGRRLPLVYTGRNTDRPVPLQSSEPDARLAEVPGIRWQPYRCRVAELDPQQARYEASLGERRYAACDPDTCSGRFSLFLRRHHMRQCRVDRLAGDSHHTLKGTVKFENDEDRTADRQ